MSDTLEVRDFILDFLRKELVGPSPHPSNVQHNGEEILRPQDPPRQRYSAGVLFPMRSQVQRHEETAVDEEESTDADSPEHSEIPRQPDSISQEESDTAVETDHDVNLANQYLPSAMGLSALIDVPDILKVDVSVATYRQDESVKSEEDERPRYKSWFRVPINKTIEFEAAELVKEDVVWGSKTVTTVDGSPALDIHFISRPHPSGITSNTRLVTFTLVNRIQSENKAPRNTECFFQCGFKVMAADGHSCFLSYPERQDYSGDTEGLTLQLLYLHKMTYAVGHGCAAEWDDPSNGKAALIGTEILPIHEIKPVIHTQLEGLDLNMTTLAHGTIDEVLDLCGRLADAYGVWIDERTDEVSNRGDLSTDLTVTAFRHLNNCRSCLTRMRDGIQCIKDDPEVATAFRLMNEAILMQQIHYGISSQQVRQWVERSGRLELETSYTKPSYDDSSRKWRPFQLAFILTNLKAVADPGCEERELVDVIWFPTGGGKTEAYLGLSAFTMFLRRLRDPDHAGTSVLMRYTLRLLTTQQFQRAASLICACEFIRRQENYDLGAEPFTIGLWVGGEVSPNDEQQGVNAHRNLQRGHGVNKFILLSCPWCGAAMGPQKLQQNTKIKGYRIFSNPQRVRHICEDQECEFSTDQGLPVAVIDDHIYDKPPTMLIGTVDKFAMLAFRPRSRSIFGIDTPFPPPDLIIQDELHLISGPLGSMIGHYETVIDALCTTASEDMNIRPKIIASTATIARAESQVQALYGRSAFLFPPQALKAGDSFFAEEREDEEGRRYVGVLASALPSHVTSQIRTIAALLQAPKSSSAQNPSAIDPYWTMMGYFNSLRELGHAATLIRADIREYLNAMWDRLGFRLEEIQQLQIDPRRFINRDVELTSRVQSNDIPSILQNLFEEYTESSRNDAIDVCFATNMIQVGLDIPRLSLMTIVGQPKTTSEYIQASSRVGRRRDSPGIVVTNYNPTRSRDRSHYEHFHSYHQTLYKFVEPTSVTPFAVPVRERALHALIVILCRFWGGSELRDRPSQPPDEALTQRIKHTIRERVMSVDCDEWVRTEAHIDRIIEKWRNAPRTKYGDFGSPTEELPMMFPAGGQRHPDWPELPYPTPSSMRNVDASCSARPLTGGYGGRDQD